MFETAIHRVIERHAATRGESIALIDDSRSLTYRELNHRANAVARALIGHGFRRGSVGYVNLARDAGLAIVCLGILKAGGAYALVSGPSWPRGVSFASPPDNDRRYVVVDVSRALSEPVQGGPNLPVLTRPGDVACALLNEADEPMLLVPHATITALRAQVVPTRPTLSDDAAAFELWLGLMAGVTVVLGAERALSAA